MDTTNQNLKPLVGFANWAYDIREVAPGFEQVSLYRDNISRFVAPVDVAHEKLLANLKNIASEMEFDIQRELSQRLYGFDFVAQSNDVFADVANVNIRRFLVRHAVSLKNSGMLDCGVRSVDAPEFLDIIEGNGKQILEIVSYLEKMPNGITVCGERWRLDDMRTPTEFSRRRNMALARDFLEDKSSDGEGLAIYSFVIDSRKVVSMLKTICNDAEGEMPSLWKLSYYELKQIVPLSWPLLAFGLDHGFIQTDVGMCFCLDEVSRKGTSDEQDVDLLCATDEDSIRRSIYGRVSDAERNSVAVKSQWVHVLLWLSCMRGHDANEILDWVERIYAEFDYPKEIAPFVRYMPTKGMANTPEGLTNALKKHLDEWRKKMFTDRDMNETDVHSSALYERQGRAYDIL